MGIEQYEETIHAKEDIKTTIVLDSGHGGYDTGCIANDGTYEKDITLAIALKTGALLSSYGYHVVYTRTSDEVSWSNNNKDDLATRVAIAQETDADYYISIHMNASENLSLIHIYITYHSKMLSHITMVQQNQMFLFQRLSLIHISSAVTP